MSATPPLRKLVDITIAEHENLSTPPFVIPAVEIRKTEVQHRERETGPYSDPVHETRIIITTDWKEAD